MAPTLASRHAQKVSLCSNRHVVSWRQRRFDAETKQWNVVDEVIQRRLDETTVAGVMLRNRVQCMHA
jgi:hypothetical protein